MNEPIALRKVESPDENVIGALEGLLDRARCGELRSISYIGTLTGNRVIDDVVGYTPDRFSTAGMWLSMAMKLAGDQ